MLGKSKYAQALLLLAVLGPTRQARAQGVMERRSSWPVDTTSAPNTQFARFLSLSVATRVPHVGMVDSVYVSGINLGVDEMDDDMRWLAAYRVLSLRTKGDTGWATAIITSTARQRDDGHGWTARYEIREDTAHWMLIRSPDTGGSWMVWGDAAEGFGVFHIGRRIKWVKGSKRKALAAVDSIRKARGLPLLR